MAKQVIGIGSSYDDPSADKIRDGFDKVNDNFTELYNCNPELEKSDVIPIGAWNMDSTASIDVPWDKYASNVFVSCINVWIISDTIPSEQQPLNAWESVSGLMQGGFDLYQGNIELRRRTGGIFDSTAFDSIAMNRGYIHINYIEL